MDYHMGNAETGWGAEPPKKHQQSREPPSLDYQNHTQELSNTLPEAREKQGYQLTHRRSQKLTCSPQTRGGRGSFIGKEP